MKIVLNRPIPIQLLHRKKPIIPYAPYFFINSYGEAVDNDFICINL